MKQPALTHLAARREPFSKGEKLLFGALPLAMLGFVLSGLWLSRGEETPQIQFPAPAALPSPNGFDFYVAAAGAITPSVPAVDPIDDPRGVLTTNPKIAAQNYSLARRQAWLGANAAGFALFRQGLATPSRYPGDQAIRSQTPLRQLARDKVIEANTLILQKRWGEAVNSSLDTIQMGNDIARGAPATISLPIIDIGRDPLTTSQLVPERLSSFEAKSAARRLEAILASRPNYKDALIAEKWAILTTFLGYVQKGNWRAIAAQNNPQMTWRERLATQFLSAGEVAKRISESCDQSVRDIQKPFNVALAPAPPLDPLTRSFAYRNDLRFYEGREIVTLDVLMLRFALRAYRLENGRFPAKLDELAPRYLKQIPTDYFASGAPFGYKLSGQNYILWSVGPDKTDNGAAPIVGRSGQKGANQFGKFPSLMADSTGDYVAGKSR